MSEISKPNSPIAPEVLELVKPITHKKYLFGLLGKESVEPKQGWQTDLENKFQACNTHTVEPLKEIELKLTQSHPQNSLVANYISLIREVGSAFCIWSTLKNDIHIDQTVKIERVKDNQLRTISQYFKALEDSYSHIPEQERAGLPTPQEIRARLFPKKK